MEKYEEIREQILEKQVRFYGIDAHRVARECGMRGRINTVMQTAFFAVSGVLPQGEAIAAIKDSICKTYAKKGEEIVNMNLRAVDMALAHLHEVKVPGEIGGNGVCATHPILDHAPAFVRNVLGEVIAGRGDSVPVSRLPALAAHLLLDALRHRHLGAGEQRPHRAGGQVEQPHPVVVRRRRGQPFQYEQAGAVPGEGVRFDDAERELRCREFCWRVTSNSRARSFSSA